MIFKKSDLPFQDSATVKDLLPAKTVHADGLLLAGTVELPTVDTKPVSVSWEPGLRAKVTIEVKHALPRQSHEAALKVARHAISDPSWRYLKVHPRYGEANLHTTLTYDLSTEAFDRFVSACIAFMETNGPEVAEILGLDKSPLDSFLPDYSSLSRCRGVLDIGHTMGPDPAKLRGIIDLNDEDEDGNPFW